MFLTSMASRWCRI